MPQDVGTECVVNYVEEGEKTASMYVSSALDQKDQYEVFFGGNHSRIDITTPADENKNLLIFKDSYANCFIPFLQPYFRSIIVIDPRYYYDDVDRLVTDNSITDILFLYNVDTFMTDTSLADVLEPMPESDTSPADINGTQDAQTDGDDSQGTTDQENSDENSSGDSQDGQDTEGDSQTQDSSEDTDNGNSQNEDSNGNTNGGTDSAQTAQQ